MRLGNQAVPHLVAALLLLPLAACSPSWNPTSDGWPYPAPVDWARWEQAHPGLQHDIDQAGRDENCEALYNLFGEAMDVKGPNEEVLTYIYRWGHHDGCSRFDRETADAE